MCSDAFGCIWMRLDTIGDVRTILEISKKFGPKPSETVRKRSELIRNAPKAVQNSVNWSESMGGYRYLRVQVLGGALRY